MMTACTRVAARLWLPLLKALGLLVVLLHACWHGAFKADICRNAKRNASATHAQAVPDMQQTGVEFVVRVEQRRSRPLIHTAGVMSAASCTSMQQQLYLLCVNTLAGPPRPLHILLLP
jgi:hypothetical protein